ncbi:MAG: insulinase family protein [Armatimonadia bacterium]
MVNTACRSLGVRASLPALAVMLLAASLACATPRHARAVLPNGLTVIAVEDPTSAVAAFHLAIRANPTSIPDKKSGITALSQQAFQYALQDALKDPANATFGDEIRGTRSVMGFNTEIDYCEARGQFVNDSLQPALKLLAGLVFVDQPITEALVSRSRDALTNVANDSASNVVECTYYRFLRAFYGTGSPYARPVHGTQETLANLTASDIQGFRTTFIGPNNAILTLVAPRSPQDLIRLATDTFGSCRRSLSDTRLTPPTLPEDSRVSVAALEDWRGASVMVGVPLAAFGTPDFLKAQLIFTLLEGKYGRLQRDENLRGTMGLNRLMDREYQPSVTVLPPSASPCPYLAMHTLAMPRLIEPARVAMLQHLLAFTQDAPSPEELQAAKNRLLNAYALLDLSRLNLARSVTCYELYGQDYRRSWSMEEELRALTGDSLVAFAKQYFNRHAVGLIMPGDDTE